MAAALTPEDLKKKEALKKAAREQESAPAGMPAFLQPRPAAPAVAPVVVAAPEEAAAAGPPAAAPVVVVPVEKEEPR
jgi:hypothetical protein